MQTFFYNIFTKLYPVAARIVSPFNNKAELWLKGRKDLLRKMKAAISNDAAEKIWMHCSSLGEFEQGRPLLEQFRLQYPHKKIVLTLFSPSGYEVLKDNALSHYTFYLPMDGSKHAREFVDLVNPLLVIFIKYEYWYYYLKEVSARKIPLLMASGIFFDNYIFFKWYGGLYRKMLGFFTHFFVQTETSKNLLSRLHIHEVTISGDTRFDRVLQVAAEPETFPGIEQFINHTTAIVAGSTWTEDDEALDHFANTHPQLRFIIAPHTLDKERLKECCTLYKHSVLYSAYMKMLQQNKRPGAEINTLVIDNIGMLKFLYRYATICFVGGGFGNDEVHNVLEAAVYYKPVLFGPAHDKFKEALDLVDKGGAFDAADALELEGQLEELLTDKALYKEACSIAGEYVKQNAGATNIIMRYIQENRLLIN